MVDADECRYNLKRRVASLPPLTSEVFADKVLSNKASAAAAANKAAFETRCVACDKTYYSEGAYINHLGSQKHRVLAAKLDAKAGTETESLVDSTFSLGEPMETASTTTESTANADLPDEKADEEFEEVVEGLKQTGLDDTEDPLSIRPSRATPATAQKLEDHPISARSEWDEDYEHKADLTQCLFCNYLSPKLDLNIHHMSRHHGFQIPERDYLVNLEGLINYLSETITVLHQCLYCHKGVHTTSGIQTHMRDRGHCMIAYSTEDEQMEVGEFYDFRSTYSDEEEEDEDLEVNGGVSLGVRRDVKTTTQNEAGENIAVGDDDEGWESDSTLSSVPTDEITSVPVSTEHKYNKLDLSRHHSHTDHRPHKNSDGFHSHAHHATNAVYHDDYELHLPSGRTAGHRSLRTYYRQNLRNYPTSEERAEQQRMIADARHDSDADDDESDTTEGTTRGRQVVTRANGGLGMVGVSDAKKREIRAVEKRDLKKAQIAEKRYQWGNNKRANFQKHFRDHLLQ